MFISLTKQSKIYLLPFQQEDIEFFLTKLMHLRSTEDNYGNKSGKYIHPQLYLIRIFL